MRKKILIITLYGNGNFGNKLQNYALQESLKKINYEYDVYTARVKYRNSNIIKYVYRSFKDIFNMFNKKSDREKKFIDFNHRYLKYDKKYYSTNRFFNMTKYDYYVYGSDQIWNPYNCGWTNLFLGGKSKHNISYSASFGANSIPEKYKHNYIKSFKNFDFISVREDKAKEIVEELTNRKDIEVLVDPTMLLSSKEWDNVSIRPQQLDNIKNERYILNYFLGELSESRKKEIQRIATENKCQIINILDENDPFYNSGPSEFLYLEKHAFLICTDSFHSSVFALLYDRPFVIFEREQKNVNSMNSRLDTLISKFNLKNRRYNGTNITNENINHDYTEAYEILEKEIKKSKDFLEKAFSKNDK